MRRVRRQWAGRTWIFGVRRGEWWIGARRNLECDAIEWNLFGLTMMVGRS